ncbi:hypothetical protein Taro_009089, partial [Colocasia esculenta]|nr:hypothetical protein [Colocasia esculenta]
LGCRPPASAVAGHASRTCPVTRPNPFGRSSSQRSFAEVVGEAPAGKRSTIGSKRSVDARIFPEDKLRKEDWLKRSICAKVVEGKVQAEDSEEASSHVGVGWEVFQVAQEAFLVVGSQESRVEELTATGVMAVEGALIILTRWSKLIVPVTDPNPIGCLLADGEDLIMIIFTTWFPKACLMVILTLPGSMIEGGACPDMRTPATPDDCSVQASKPDVCACAVQVGDALWSDGELLLPGGRGLMFEGASDLQAMTVLQLRGTEHAEGEEAGGIFDKEEDRELLAVVEKITEEHLRDLVDKLGVSYEGVKKGLKGHEAKAQVWDTRNPLKIKIFIWRVSHGRLPTCDKISRSEGIIIGLEQEIS